MAWKARDQEGKRPKSGTEQQRTRSDSPPAEYERVVLPDAWNEVGRPPPAHLALAVGCYFTATCYMDLDKFPFTHPANSRAECGTHILELQAEKQEGAPPATR